MLRNRRFGMALAGLALLVAIKLAFATPVSQSKHNLSTSGSGSIKAVTEQQICVFCHTPHGANTAAPVAPLWNRTTSTTTTYTLYTSSYLTDLGYTSPVLGSTQSSRVCLSCHDGTIAIGSVKNINGAAGTISMQVGASAITAIPAGRPANFGTDLSDDHPVGYLYDTAKDPELDTSRTMPWAKSVGVFLDPNTAGSTYATSRVECKTCHDPHNNQYTKFLRISNSGGALCKTCHIKTDFSLSGHQLSTQNYTPYDRPATTVGNNACLNCHKPHGGLGKPLLRYAEEDTCFNAGCHGNNLQGMAAGVNTTQNSGLVWLSIQSEMPPNKAGGHPTVTSSNLHNDRSASVNYETTTQLGSTNRHAECYDCHNPHQVRPAVQKSNRWDATNNKPLRISAALKGMWGVQPTWQTPPTGATITTNQVDAASGTPALINPSGYTIVSGVNLTDEYQLCMKCHSNYVTLPSGARNIAREINPMYSSYHGIVYVSPATYGVVASGVPNGMTNYFVNQTTMAQPWAGWGINGTQSSPGANITYVKNTNTLALPLTGSTEYLRKQALAGSVANYVRGRVWCSDCHGSDASTMPPSGTTKTAPYGPHGSTLGGQTATDALGGAIGTSNSNRMLIATIVSANGSPWTPLCLKCHGQGLSAGAYDTSSVGSRLVSRHGNTSKGNEGCFSCHMWENVATVTGGSGLIYPHGMNKRWVTLGTSTSVGSGQMVDSFNGGWYTNIDYNLKQCSTTIDATNTPAGSLCKGVGAAFNTSYD